MKITGFLVKLRQDLNFWKEIIMGNRKKEQEAFEQMFKKKTNPFGQAATGKSASVGGPAKGSPAKGTQVRSTRQTNRGI